MSAGNAPSRPAWLIGFIAQRDDRLMRRVHRWRAPRWFRLLMVASTRAGDGWLWNALGFVLLIVGGHNRFRAVFTASLAFGMGLALYSALKRTTRRQRPCAREPHCWARLMPPDQYSFPSGHTITAFSIATSLTFFYPALALPLFCCTLLIATSRIVLGMHFISDVVAGAIIGMALGCLAHEIFPVVLSTTWKWTQAASAGW